jgi:hypothetical protein
MWHLSRHRRSRFARYTVAAASLAAYVISVVGVPVSTRVVRDRDVPFPCQDHACGCHSAAECWEHCCCFTPGQRLAWCREHGVAPPERLMAQLSGSHDGSLLAVGRRHRAASCCASHEHDCEAASRAEIAHHDGGGSTGCHPDAGESEGESAGIVLVIGPLARHCRGLVDLWSLSGAVLPAPAPVEWQFQWVVVAWLVPTAAVSGSCDLAPPVPPPRV